MALVQNFNVNPYYDDYDEDKKFLRMLFRPGYAIQARELTQLQTLLQKQVSRFGKHVFKNGSVVTGGEVSISTTVLYHKLKTTTTAGDDIDVNNFLGKGIGNAHALLSGGTLGKVVAVIEGDDTDPPTIIVEYKTALSLVDAETLFTIDNDQFQARLIDSSSTGRAAVAYVNEGVYFIDDFFVKVSPQTLVLEKYSNIPTYKIGLTYAESIINETTDTSLLDPALNASNYQAPGATRYKVELTLEKRSSASIDDTKFIELIRTENGIVTLRNNYPLYAELERTLARRTYDESGNYTVKPFTIYLKDHVADIVTANGNPDKFTAKLSSGKAYVRGFEVETVSTTNLELDRARETASVQNYDIAANYGNYVNIANTKGLLDVSTMAVLDMHNVNTSAISTSSPSAYNATKIGTVRVRELEYTSATNTSDANTFKYRLYLNDTRFTTNNTIKDIESFAVVNAATLIVASANVDNSSKIGAVSNGDVYFSDTDFKELIFRVPQSFVAFGMSDQDYRGRAVFRNQTVSTGTLSISTGLANNVFVGSGSLSDSQKLEHFYVVANSASGVSEFTNGQVIPMVSASSRTVSVSGSTATLNLNSANTFTVDVIASVDYNTSSPKTKTLVSANTTVVNPLGSSTAIGNTTVYVTAGQIAISTPNKTPGSSDTLYISDIYKLEGQFEENYGYFDINVGGTTKKSSFKVIDSGNSSISVSDSDLTDSSKDITTRYVLDDGQRDGHYDHGAIRLKQGVAPPTGRILVLVNYFTHTGSGYISVDSYNNNSLGANTNIRYTKIPNYTSPTTGKSYKLRDCIDFRPIRTNASNTTPNFILSGIGIPKAGEALESDYSYYLPRIDRIALTEERKFEVIKGISSLNPQTPAEPDNSMSLYTIQVNPYTFFPSDTQIKYIENRRYTMRDIGRLEKRIENLEYYTSLNTLEKSAQDLTVLDSSGLTRFKNGILVDSFRGHQVGDVKNLDYNCSMNFEEGELRPSFVSNSVSFVANTSLTTATIKAQQIALSPFTVQSFITQNVATSALAVNPFTLSNYSGTLDFFPSGDFWIDTETRPDVLVNLEGENDAWEQIGKALEDSRAPGWGNQWNSWNSFVSGTDVDVDTRTATRTEGFLDYRDTIQDTTTSTFYSRERSGTKKILVPERIVKSIGKRQVDLSVIPYVRAQWIITIAKGLRPNQYHYVFTNQGDTDGTKYIEYPAIAWLYNTTGDFNDSYGIYETITSSSGGTAKLLKQSGRSWSLNQPIIFLGDVRGTFAANDTVTGATSGATGRIDIMFWNNGNVTTAAASTITLGSGAPYNNTYVDVVSTYQGVTWPYSGTKVLEDPKEKTQFYKIRILAGKGLGQERTITAYNGSTKVATITPNWDVIPDNTSRWSVGKPQSDDHGEMAGRWFLPNYGPTAYDNGFRTRTGALTVRMCNDANNRSDFINSFAEEFWHAQGVLNIVEDVSVSVRVPTIQNKTIYEKENNYRQTSVTRSEVTGTTLIADNTPVPASGGGGGGSGSKIICSEMAKQGFFEQDINDADQKFGRRLQRKHPIIYRGYVYWARTIVEWLRGRGPSLYLWKMNDNNELQRNIALHMTEVVARPWAEEMARIERVRDESPLTGKLIFWIGVIICAIVGITNPDLSKPDSRLKGYTIITIMTIFYVLISLINFVTSPFKLFKEIFKNKLIRN
jgi:hypothetical protein